MRIDHTDAVHLVGLGDGEGVRGVRLEVAQMTLPPLGDGQVLVRNEYLSVDPSALGRMLEGDKVYTTNFALGQPIDGWAVGSVVESRDPGLPVETAVRHRAGWREHAVVDGHEVTAIDTGRADARDWLGILGVSGLTAYVALAEIARVQPGDSVLVSSAAGAVGSTACQIAYALGAKRVVGIAGGPDKTRIVSDLGVDAVVDRRESNLVEQLRSALPGGVDVYLDNVGGDHLVAALRNMNTGGRVALCGMMSNFHADAVDPGVGVLMEAILRRVRLEGFIALDYLDVWPAWTELALELRADGQLRAVDTAVDGLEAGIGALLGLTTGAHVGKSLVRL